MVHHFLYIGIMSTHTQVTLERNGARQTTWIETRGATIGKSVELKESGEFWNVVEVFGTVDSAVVKRNEMNYKKQREGSDI